MVMSDLWAWMNGELVGKWSRGRTGRHLFTYEASWLESPRVRSLSLSMPITPGRTVEGDAVGHFFDNLLPDDERIRRRLSTRFRTKGAENNRRLPTSSRQPSQPSDFRTEPPLAYHAT
jgi:serine/threonine-protein kinase HipA